MEKDFEIYYNYISTIQDIYDDLPLLDEMTKLILKYISSPKWHDLLKQKFLQKDKLNKKYYYLITFTLKVDPSDIATKNIERYIHNRLKAKGLQIVKCHIVRELTVQGRPHWHAAVKTNKYLSKDRFKYYSNLYGNIDISKNHSQNYDSMIEYISKTNAPQALIDGGN